MRLRAALPLGLLLVGCSHLPGPPRSDHASLPSPTPDVVAPALAGAGGAPAYDDLFARMRSGFALPAVDNAAVAREIAWYRGNPAYLERTFGRGRRYLHHIVEELEERGLPNELALLPAV